MPHSVFYMNQGVTLPIPLLDGKHVNDSDIAQIDHRDGVHASQKTEQRSGSRVMVTTHVYAGLQHNPPAIGFMGRKTWTPGKAPQRLITATFGIQPMGEAVRALMPSR